MTQSEHDLIWSGLVRRLGAVEPLIYAVASAIAVSVALVAGLPAARRATSVQPMAAMRSE